MVWCFCVCVFVQMRVLLCFVFLCCGMLCSAVMCCLWGLVLCCICVYNVSLAVLLFGCLFDVFACCHVLLLEIWLGLDVIGLFCCGWVGVWCCWECGLGGLFCMVRMFSFCL